MFLILSTVDTVGYLGMPAGNSVKITFKAPQVLHEELKSVLKKRGVWLKGGQNKELVEALKIRLAYLRGDVMKVCFENKNEVLMDIREITQDLFLEHSCEVLPAFNDNFEKKHMLYFAKLMIDIAKKVGGKIEMIVKEGNLYYYTPADMDKLTPAALVENTKLKEGMGPHIGFTGDASDVLISLESNGIGSTFWDA